MGFPGNGAAPEDLDEPGPTSSAPDTQVSELSIHDRLHFWDHDQTDWLWLALQSISSKSPSASSFSVAIKRMENTTRLSALLRDLTADLSQMVFWRVLSPSLPLATQLNPGLQSWLESLVHSSIHFGSAWLLSYTLMTLLRHLASTMSTESGVSSPASFSTLREASCQAAPTWVST